MGSEEEKEVLNCINLYIDGFPANRNGKIKIKMQSGLVDKILGFTELSLEEKTTGKSLTWEKLNVTILESMRRIKFGEISIIMEHGKAVNVQEEITYILWQKKKK